ncbi:MAG: putative ATP-dependent helicase YprA [Candidatus Sumerlaea sp.]|nr:MAG: putative ATP-dependent helicase YprA [Candidatus Sumerlaea sp.]
MAKQQPKRTERTNRAQPSVREVLEELLSIHHIARNITHLERIPPRAACYAPFPSGLHPDVLVALREYGIQQLYSHQAQAIEAVLRGEHVVVVTPTASGKTLCYNVPVLSAVLENPKACALYLFPTKALAQDQYQELYSLAGTTGKGIKLYTFDGDTPASARRAIREAGNIVLTNPDMLHTGILPHHTAWCRIFENLRYIVVDEVHQYRGVFGSHVANVFRRLRRICDFYGVQPQFICCSATIANPKEVTERLIDHPVTLISENGAPAGEKFFVFYNPPIVNEELGIRRGVVNEARRLASRFLAEDIQTIVFARSRMQVELLVNYLRKTMRRLGKSIGRIAGYRGGYLPNERRSIERGIKEGAILGVVSTNALELGIDIGQLNAAILAGYPGSVASTWQQAGRAGRSTETSVAVLIANSSALDQYIISHPGYFFGRAPEQAIVNPENPAIAASHIKCAAFELPFLDGEPFGSLDPTPLLEHLEAERIVRHSGNKWFWSAETYPSENISLRSASSENFVVVNLADQNRVFAEVDFDSAPFLIHTEAIYMHLGETYYVEHLDWDRRTAFARPQRSDYYTEAISKTEIRVLQIDEKHDYAEIGTAAETGSQERGGLLSEYEKLPTDTEYPLTQSLTDGPPAAGDLPEHGSEKASRLLGEQVASSPPPKDTASASASLSPTVIRKGRGDVAVITIVSAYKKLRFESHENIGYGTISLPPLEMQTEACWLTFDARLKEELEQRQLDLSHGLQGIAHLLGQVVPLYVLCDARDIGAVAMVQSPHDGLPTIYLYDRYPGGIGLSQKVFEMDRTILRAAWEIVEKCPCAAGCPSCVGPEVAPLGKASALHLLRSMFCPPPDQTHSHCEHEHRT